MKTRIIWTKIWDDAWFDTLSQNARLLFLYLLTNQDIGLSGCYYLTDKKMGFNTHLTKEEIAEAKKELDPKAKFYEEWVYLVNAQGYNGFVGSKNEVAIKREIQLIPLKVKEALGIDKVYTPSIGYSEQQIPLKSEIINNKSETIKQKSYKLVGNTMVESE